VVEVEVEVDAAIIEEHREGVSERGDSFAVAGGVEMLPG